MSIPVRFFQSIYHITLGVNLEYHTLKLYPFAEEPVSFLFISRIYVEKDIEEYLVAEEAVHRENPNTEFHIIGGW